MVGTAVEMEAKMEAVMAAFVDESRGFSLRSLGFEFVGAEAAGKGGRKVSAAADSLSGGERRRAGGGGARGARKCAAVRGY